MGTVSHAKSLQAARSRLRAADRVVARLIDERPDFDPKAWLAQLPPMDLYGALLFQIVGQQLSVAATRRILGRIEALFGGRLPAPVELLAVDPDSLRQAGLSWRKIGTLRDLAERLSDGRLNVEALSRLPDDELIAALTAVPGIGPWNAQAALLIALQRYLGQHTVECRPIQQPGEQRVSTFQLRNHVWECRQRRRAEIAVDADRVRIWRVIHTCILRARW